MSDYVMSYQLDKGSGKTVSKSLSFSATNDNHAIYRTIATLFSPAVNSLGWHVNILDVNNQIIAQAYWRNYRPLYVNGNAIDAHNWTSILPKQ